MVWGRGIHRTECNAGKRILDSKFVDCEKGKRRKKRDRKRQDIRRIELNPINVAVLAVAGNCCILDC